MRPLALALLVVPLLLAGCAEDPAGPPHEVTMVASKARGEMPGALELDPDAMTGSPGVAKLKALLEETLASPETLGSASVTEEETRDVLRFLHERWGEKRAEASQSLTLVRYRGTDFTIRFSG